MEVIPPNIPDSLLREFVGDKHNCKFCQVESIASYPETNWVLCPIKKKGEQYICIGCCLDTASICCSDRVTEHPFYEDLVKIANLESLSVEQTRKICLNHQKKVLLEYDNKTEVEQQYLRKIDELLQDLQEDY